MKATQFAPGLIIAGITPPLRLTDFKLIAFAMDSTLTDIECVDEMPAAVGRKPQVAAITEAAMRGEISDYKESLRQRVALLKGVTVADMERIYQNHLQLNPGAAELVSACQQAGLKVLLVSGGFPFFTDRIRDRLGIDYSRANVLELENGVLTGPGAIFAMALKSAPCCCKPVLHWTSARARRLPWATAPTTCR